MHKHPAMEPLWPDPIGPLADIAADIYKVSAKAAGHVHPIVFRELGELLRVVNSYYSNLIEGNSTHPIDVMRAMASQFDQDPAKRARQLESVAHIEVQEMVEDRLADEPSLAVTSPEFVIWLHAEFYRRLPDELRQLPDPSTGEVMPVEPGQLRTRPVAVGLHVAPDPGELPRFLDRFHQFFNPDRFHGHDRLIAAAAAHHRLLWINPFPDGNGRVARLTFSPGLHND